MNDFQTSTTDPKTQAMRAAEDLRTAASEQAQRLRSAAETRADQFRSAAGDQAESFRNVAEQNWDQTLDKLKDLQTDLERIVREKPTQSVVVSFAAGLFLGMLFRR